MEQPTRDTPQAHPSIRPDHASTILEHLPDGILRVTREGLILDYKPSTLNLLRVETGRSLEGKHISELAELTPALDEELLERCLRQAHLALERDEPQRFEVQLKQSSWPLWLELRATRSGEDDVVVVMREVSRERRYREYRESELDELRKLAYVMDEERRFERKKLAERLARLVPEAPEGLFNDALRALVNELAAPQKLDPQQLEQELKTTAEELCGDRFSTNLRFDLTPEHISPEVATGIYATVKEALACSAQHSAADRVRVSLVTTPERLSLLISDNADEESSTDARARAVCIAKVRYQAQRLGGTLRVVPGRRGTALRMQLSLEHIS